MPLNNTKLDEVTLKQASKLVSSGLKDSYQNTLEVRENSLLMDAFVSSCFQAYFDRILVTYQGKDYEIPRGATVILKDDLDNVESVGIVSLNVTQWGGVFYSVDLIVTRDRTPKQVFRLLRELAELMLLHYTNPKFPKLPILVETQYTPLLERFFKRVSKEGVVETATNIFCTSVLSFKEQ